MARTFRIRRRTWRNNAPPIIVEQSEVAKRGDISLDFNVSTPEGVEAVRGYLGLITKVEVTRLKSVYWYPWIGWVLILLVGVPLFGFFCYCAWYLVFHHKDHPVWSLSIAAAWTVAVPAYFFIEHEFIFFYCGDPDEYEQFKRVQDLAAKIWAGGIAVLGAILAVNLH